MDPAFEKFDRRRSPDRARPALLAAVAVAACSVIVIGGLVAIGTRDNDPAPATPANTARPEAAEPADPGLDLIRIDARASAQGMTGVVLVFDGEVPSGSPELLSDPTASLSDRIGYITQASGDSTSGISVCGNTHWFPPPGNRTVDVFVPSDWFGSIPLTDPPVEWGPDGVAPSKIVVCDPRDGVVQISVWGAASGRVEDVDVSVDAHTIIVDIIPDTTPRRALPPAAVTAG